MASVQSIDVPWYREAEYADLRASVEDPQTMHATHAEWLKAATDGVDQLIAQGFTVNKVDFDQQLFFAWCRWRGRKVDTHARSDFAVERAATLAEKSNHS